MADHYTWMLKNQEYVAYPPSQLPSLESKEVYISREILYSSWYGHTIRTEVHSGCASIQVCVPLFGGSFISLKKTLKSFVYRS